MSQAPVVAIAGATGRLGNYFTNEFTKATNDGLFQRLHLLTTDASKEVLKPYINENSAGKIVVIQVDYKNEDSLLKALDGVDVLVNTISGVQVTDSHITLARAAHAKGVKAYLPSEWSADYTNFTHKIQLLEDKKRHVEESRSLGLNVIAVSAGFFIDIIFSRMFGIDSAANTWTIPGDGTKRVAFISRADIAKYAVRIVILAHSDTSALPSRIHLSSDVISWNQCADLMDSVSGKPFIRTYVPSEQYLTALQAAKDKGFALGEMLPGLNLAYLEGHLEFPVTDDKLLNPEHRYFKPQTVADYAKEVGGKPWLTGNPLA